MPLPDPSPETLALVAAFSWCLTDCLERLGKPNTPPVRKHIAYRLKNERVDTTHWARSPRRIYSDESLAEAVAQSISYAGALRLLGVPVTGGQHAHLARRIRAAGIDTAHFLGQAHNKGRRLPRKTPEELLVVRPPGSSRPQGPVLRRAMIAVGVEHVCEVCGLPAVWRDQPLTLAVDHISGDWLDNRPENLRFLCPNCHAQTSTWCRRRKSPLGSDP